MLMPDGLAVKITNWMSFENWEEVAMFMDKVEKLYKHPELILVVSRVREAEK